MRFNKLVAALSAVTMLGSLVASMPASAATSKTVYPVAGVHVRDNNNFTQYNTLDVTNTNVAADTQYEMQWGSQFAAIYKFDLSEYINDKVDSISVYTGDSAYSVMPYTKMPANTADDATAFKTFVADNIASASTGTTITLNWDSVKSGADSSGNVYLIFTRNSTGQWKKNIDMNSTPYLTINSTAPVVKNETQSLYYYTSLHEAAAAANENDTIKVLSDFTYTTGRTDVGKSLTITADSPKTITVKENGAVGLGGLLVNSWATVNMNNISLYPYNGITTTQATLCVEKAGLTMTNGTVTGDAYLKENGGTGANLTLVNTTVTGGANVTGNSRLTLTSGATVQGTVTLASASDSLTADSTASIGGLSLAGYSEGDIVVTKTGDTALSPSQVTTLTGVDGLVLDTDASGNLILAAAPAAPTDAYFSFTGENGVSYDKIEVTATNGNDTQTKTAPLGTTISGGSLYVAITGVPAGIEITSIYLK